MAGVNVPTANDMLCPDCGTPMGLEDKSTFTGRDMRTYRCEACGREEIVDNGVALWKLLSDAREEAEQKSAEGKSPE